MITRSAAEKDFPDTRKLFLEYAIEHRLLVYGISRIGPMTCMQGWGLHVWADVRAETAWQNPLLLQGCFAHALSSIGIIECSHCETVITDRTQVSEYKDHMDNAGMQRVASTLMWTLSLTRRK